MIAAEGKFMSEKSMKPVMTFKRSPILNSSHSAAIKIMRLQCMDVSLSYSSNIVTKSLVNNNLDATL